MEYILDHANAALKTRKQLLLTAEPVIDLAMRVSVLLNMTQ